MGGLGLIFARYLATKYQAKLILTGRSGLSPEKQIQLRTLEALGAEVIYLERDVADQNDAKALIKESQQQFGAINGIIHSAGVIRRGFIRETTKEDIRQILPPKVAGTLYLDEYLKDEKLDFFVLFSSISAEIESLGLPGYAFANGFLDHFAHWREQLRANGKRVGKTLFINWPLWKEGGMQPGKQTEKILSQTLGMALLKTESGVNAFARGLTFRQTGFLFVEGNPDKIRHVLLGAKQARLQNLPLKESQSSAQTNQQKLLHKIQDDLLNIVATLLKKDQDTIELNETLYTYGFDSLSLTEFAGQLNEKYQLSDHLNPITPSVFFEHSTIASLSEYLLKDYSQEMANFYIGFISNTQEIETDVSSKPVSEPIVSSRTAVFAALRLATQHNEPMPIAIIGMSGMMPTIRRLSHLLAASGTGK
jgi:polyketide synthase PksN